ncbi:AraC family transcriptional regulator [Rhizobium sp. YIM 134829]|uniref:AraC family transcriptional regulator n=1 Tax=Rhizobium sp. YIM 134829 TaxID=3390453 RepID=UPI00397E41BB
MDPLSDILALLKPKSTVSAGFSADGDWSLQFAAYEGIKFNAVIEGSCWLKVEGDAPPVRLEAGDCFLLSRGRPFRLASDLSLPAIDAAALFAARRENGVVKVNGGGSFFLSGSRFTLDGAHAGLLLDILPPVMLLAGGEDGEALRWSLDRLRLELLQRRPGSALVAEHLAQMMLVQALRLYASQHLSRESGWLFALSDRQIGAAVAALHAEPARDWRLEELAAGVAMSRTAFAVRFKRLVGLAPMACLTRWRMMLACDRLSRSRDPVSTIAASLGYASESAFGVAFRKAVGCSPRRYGRRLDGEDAPVLLAG